MVGRPPTQQALRVRRVRGNDGQTTIEWLAVMVGFTALVTVLAGDDVWRQAGRAIVDAVNAILGQADDKV